MGSRGFDFHSFGGGFGETLKIINPSQGNEQGFLFSRRGIGEVRQVLCGPLGDEGRPLEQLYRPESRAQGFFVGLEVAGHAGERFPLRPGQPCALPENEILAGATFILAVNLNKELPHQAVNAVPVDNLPNAVLKEEVVLQFSLPGEQLRIGVAVFDEGGLALAVCAGEGNEAVSEAVKVDKHFLFFYALHNADSALESQGYQFPIAHGLHRAPRCFRFQAFNFFQVSIGNLDIGVLRPDFKLFSRGIDRRDFSGADGFNGDGGKCYT
jgi:hypothetical protein